MKQSQLMRIAVAVGLLFAVLHPAIADDWPQFRGPNCTGVSAGNQSLPVEFSLSENLGWTADVGDGIGSAVIAADRVFVSGMTATEQVSLFAFNARTGKQLWRRDWPTGPLAKLHAVNSQASSTPAADADRVYFYFSTLGLISVDARNGEDVWHRKLPTPFFVFKWGPGMSPVLYQDMVLFCQDDDLNPAFYAFDIATGELRWKDDRLDMSVNYSHPVISTANGREDIVVGGTGMLVGYDPSNGHRRWFAKVLLRNMKTTPICRDGVIYVSLQSSGIANQWIAAVDRDEHAGNNDGRLDKKEIQRFVGARPVPVAFLKRTFDRGDIDKDGFLAGKELDVAFLHPNNFAGQDFNALGDAAAEQYIMAIRGGGTGDVSKSHVLWMHKTKHTDHVVSPYVSDDRLFLLKSGGITTVFDINDGTSLRRPKRIGRGGDYYASPVSGDGNIYLASESGDIVVLKDDASYKELARNNIDESIVASPSIAGDSLFIRSRTRLHCFRLSNSE